MPTNPALFPLAQKLAKQPGEIGVLQPGHGPLPHFRTFTKFGEWFAEIDRLSLNSTVPEQMSKRWTRVQSAYLVAWLSPDLLTAADLVSFTALEYAVLDRYGHLAEPRPKFNPRKPNELLRVSFAVALDYIVTSDGLTDEKLPFIQRYGGTVTGRFTKADQVHPTLPEVRNRLAHGEPIESGPFSGLLELTRDLIDYTYRNWPEL